MSLILCTIPFQKSGIMIGNICWTDPVPKGLYKELCMYSAHCMQLGVQCTQLCTVYTCTPAGGVQGNIWTFVSSIFLHFLHISHLWREGCRERPPFCTGLVTYFASLRPSSPSQHHFHFQEVLKRFTKSSRRKSSVMWRNLESDTFQIGHFLDRTLYNGNKDPVVGHLPLLPMLLPLCSDGF